MATYYFDSIAGNDSNSGTSWATAFQGTSKQIATYIASGNIVWLRGSWSNQIFGTYSGLSSFELRPHPDDGALLDCRTRHNSGWTNVLSSKVWKKTYGYQCHRLFLGTGAVTGFTEGSDAAKRAIQPSFDSGTACTDAQVVAVLDAGVANQTSFWYWDGVSSTLYVRSTSSSVDPDTAYSGVWTTDGSDAASTDRRRWYPFYFSGCPSLYFGAVEVRGAVRPLTLDNCSGTIEPFLTDAPHYQWPTLATIGGTSGNRKSLTINNPKILLRRPYFDNDIFQSQGGQSDNDGNGIRTQGGADCITIEAGWTAWNMYGGTIESGVHGAVTSQAFHGALVTSGIIQGTYFDLTNLRYGRAFNLQSSASGAITAFTIDRCTIQGQPVNAQVNWDNLNIKNCVWRNGRFGWFGIDGNTAVYNDKYIPTKNWQSRWRNSWALDLSFVDGVAANNMIVEDSIFWGQHDGPLTYQSTTNTSHIVRNNWFIRNSGLAGPQYGTYLFFNDTNPVDFTIKTVTFTGNKYAGGYTQIPSGFTAMSAGEQTLYTARAQATSFTYLPSPATPSVGYTQSVTLTAKDQTFAAVSGFAGLVATSAAAGTATVVAPTAATNATGQVAFDVTGVAAGSTTLTLRAIQGAATSTLPVTVSSSPPTPATGVRVIQSAIVSADTSTSIAATLSGVTPGNKIIAFTGGYFAGAAGVTVADNQSPASSWTQQAGIFRTGGPSSSIGVFAHLATLGPSTTNVTVTATPTQSPVNPYSLAAAYPTAMTSLNDFAPGNLQNTTWPQSQAFPTYPWGSNVDQMITSGATPVGTQEGVVVSRGSNRFLTWVWLMPPKNVLNAAGNWRVQIDKVQVAAKVDSLSNAWNLFFGPVSPNPGYGNNSLGGLKLSGNITNSDNTTVIYPYDNNVNPLEARVEATGGVSVKNVSTAANLFQLEINVPDGGEPQSLLPASVTSERTKAFAGVFWARLIPDTGNGPLPAGIQIGAINGVDFYGPSGRTGNPGWSRLVQLDANWRPVVMAFVLDPNTPNQPMSPSAISTWLSANPPPFV